jgi:WD40 repeat protein
VWNLATPQSEPRRLPAWDSVSQVAFSQDGKLLAAACGRQGVILFDTANLNRHLFMEADCVFGVAISHDNRFVAIPGRHGGAVTLWNLLRNREVAVLKHPDRADMVGFSTDGRTLVTANGKAVRIWNLAGAEEKLVLHGHHGPVWGAAFSPDGKLLATRGDDRQVRIWDTATGRQHKPLTGFHGFGSTVAFSADGGLLAAGDDDAIRIWEMPSRQEVAVPSPEHGLDHVASLGFSPDGKYLAAGVHPGRDNRGHSSGVILWRIRVRAADEGKGPRYVLEKPERLSDDPVSDLCFSPNRNQLASTEWSKLPNGTVKLSVHVRDLENGRSYPPLPARLAGAQRAIAFLPDSRHLALIGPLGLPEVWDVATGKQVWSFAGAKYEGGLGIAWMALSADGALLAQSAMAPRVWDLENKRLLFELPEERNRPACFAWSRNRECLAVGYADGELVIWDLPKIREHLAKIGLDW